MPRGSEEERTGETPCLSLWKLSLSGDDIGVLHSSCLSLFLQISCWKVRKPLPLHPPSCPPAWASSSLLALYWVCLSSHPASTATWLCSELLAALMALG